MIKVEVGKRYVRNDGVVTGVMAEWYRTDYVKDPSTGNLYITGTGCRYTEGPSHPTSISHEYKENNEVTAQDTTFVKTVTRKEIKWHKDINPNHLGYARISVVPDGDSEVDIVIGAAWNTKQSSNFDKESLTNLIAELTAIRDALK